MKISQKIALVALSIPLLVCCDFNANTSPELSDQATRQEIMASIANDKNMSEEMISIMMDHNDDRSIHQHIMGNRNELLKMMKENPIMRQHMLSVMMETVNNDSVLSNEMIEGMSKNPQMLLMMQHKSGNQMMDGTGSMGNMDK